MSTTTEAIVCYGVEIPDGIECDDALNLPRYLNIVIHGYDGGSHLILSVNESIQIVEPGEIKNVFCEVKHTWNVLLTDFLCKDPIPFDISPSWEAKWYLVCSRF